MFRLIGALLALMWTWVLAADGPPADPPSEADPPNEGDPPQDPPQDPPGSEAEITLSFKDDKAKQEWMDKQFSERYKRKQQEIREQERTKVEKELQEKQAKEKGEYKELYETAETKIGEQAARISELESQIEDIEAKNERIESLESQVEAFIKPDLQRVPEHYRELVGAMSLDQQASWLTRNRENLEGPTEPIGSLSTPRPPRRDVAREQKQEDKEVAEAQRQRVAARL